jgi:hypothetical protein
MNIKLAIISFFLVAALTLVFVVFVFDPISARDTSTVSIHPIIGFLTYVLICVCIFEWGNCELHSPYKAAFIVAAPQAALILDLVLRGDRGPYSGAAGIAMVGAIWTTVAINRTWLARKLEPREG